MHALSEPPPRGRLEALGARLHAAAWREVLAGLVGLAALLHLTPLIGLSSKHSPIPGSAMGDTVRGLWGAWFVAAELPSSPFHSTLTAFPEGADIMAVPPVGLLLVSPVTALAGPAAGLVALCILYSVLAGIGGALLARVLGAGPWGGGAAGVVLMTWPLMREALSMGIYEYLSLGWGALCLAALIVACRGRLRAAPLAGLFFVVALFESGYFGVALVPAVVLAVVASVRSLRGLGGAALSGIVVVVLAVGGWQLVASAMPEPGAGVSQVAHRIVLAPQELVESVVAWWPSATFRAGPRLEHWLLLLGGVLLAPRRVGWLAVYGVLGVCLALRLPGVSSLLDLPFVAPLAYVRRFIGPAGLAFAALAGVSCSVWIARRRSPWWGPGLVSGLYISGAMASGLWFEYPMLWPPEPADFVERMVEDSADGAVLIYPQQDRRRARRLTTQPDVSEPTLSNPQVRLLLQTWTGRPMRHHVGVGTSIRVAEADMLLDLPVGRASLDRDELDVLRQAGLRYVLLDAQLLGPELAGARSVLEGLGASCTPSDDWGGVVSCRFGDEP